MSINITYESSRNCDYDSRQVEERLSDLVERSSNSLGTLVELLVDANVLSLDDAYAAFKGFDDYRDVERVE